MLIHKAHQLAVHVLLLTGAVGLFCAPVAAKDPVAELQAQLDRGDLKLNYEATRGYLASVLHALKVPVDSQGLVFSKTSFQASRISPQTPRALYFNDDVYVGWVWGGDVIELASVDPQHGPVFYLLYQKKTQRPRFIRENASCLQCHQSQLTGDVPGLLMRSVYPDHTGMPVLTAGTYVTTDQSPMSQRWGGWYMDGKSAEPGLANGLVNDANHPEDLSGTGDSFRGRFDASEYLSAHSDPVALLVLAHQTHLHNLLTKAHDETLAALKEEAAIAQVLGDKTNEHSDSTLARIKAVCEPVVQCMLFSGEAKYPGPIEGSSGFTSRFESLGPRDSKGRSLRDFDLRRRLFKYPCSYLIYSEQFDSLPDAAKQYIYRRMWKILTGRDDSPAFNHLSDADRDAIYQILRQTKKDLPAYWNKP
ncbi:MAG TPA: hypothetical protein VN541_14340 [Tepidisphaeraceae bacterium]|nr:hypothetical protein [Tepidisphaeraceae bacterium]